MSPRAEQGATQKPDDSLAETLLRELIDKTGQSKAGKKTITDILAEELLGSLKETEHTPSEDVSLETIIMAQTLAPALADALAPALADALAPALVKVANTLIASGKTSQEGTSKKGTD